MNKLKLIWSVIRGHAVAYNLAIPDGIAVEAKPYEVPERPLKGAGCVTA